MRSVWLKSGLVALMLFVPWQSGLAAGDWIISLHGGQTEIDRTVRSDGDWWNRIDDDRSSLGASLGYDFIPELGVRLMYERATGFAGVNQCPPGMVCPAVVLFDEADADLWSLAVVPRWYVTPTWSVFGTAGVTRWKLSTNNVLPGGSGTEVTYGIGTSWLASPNVEIGVEFQRSEMVHETVRLNLGWRFSAW